MIADFSNHLILLILDLASKCSRGEKKKKKKTEESANFRSKVKYGKFQDEYDEKLKLRECKPIKICQS